MATTRISATKGLNKSAKARRGEPLSFLEWVAAAPPADCIPWPYGIDGAGYGALRYRGRKIGAHRLAWQLYHGREMGDGNHAAHAPEICHNKLCVNPLHIREATPIENAADRTVDLTDNRGERQGQSKLCPAQVLAIRGDNRRLREIAADYGVCEVTVSDIKHRRTWAWLSPQTEALGYSPRKAA